MGSLTVVKQLVVGGVGREKEEREKQPPRGEERRTGGGCFGLKK